MAKKENIRKQKLVEKPEWNDDVSRLILYADFMGFKNRVFSSNHKDLKDLLIKFNESWHRKLQPLMSGGDLKFVQFSDSILVVANGTTSKMFNLISKAAVCMMHEALKINFGIKGVIAQGVFSFDEENDIYFGRPLVDAFLLHEDVKYYGVVVHHSAENIVKVNLSDSNPYSKKDIFIEKGKVTHYHLCWNLVDTALASNDITDTCNSWLDAIEETVSGAPRQYIDRTRYVMQNDQELFGTLNDELEGVELKNR